MDPNQIASQVTEVSNSHPTVLIVFAIMVLWRGVRHMQTSDRASFFKGATLLLFGASVLLAAVIKNNASSILNP